MWMPPACVPSARWTAKKPFTSLMIAVERTRLVAVVGLDQCCRASDRTTTPPCVPFARDSADERRQAGFDLVVRRSG
jgi:hypothetical protein